MKAQFVSLDFSTQNVRTYFCTSDVTPRVNDDNEIEVWNGTAYRASWGSSNVTSQAGQLADDVAHVKVVGWHKHTVGPVGGDYYFVAEGGRWVRRRANHKRVKAVLN